MRNLAASALAAPEIGHQDPLPAWWASSRFTHIVHCAAANAICYVDRTIISVAIIPMAKEFGFTAQQKGVVMSSFFWGYILSQLPGGWAAVKCGAKPILSLAVFFWSLFTLLTLDLSGLLGAGRA